MRLQKLIVAVSMIKKLFDSRTFQTSVWPLTVFISASCWFHISAL